MGHKLSYIGNVGAISQFNQIVERNVMCLRSVPFPKTFFCPKQLTYLNVGTNFSAGTAINNTPSVKLLTSLGFKLVEQEKVSFYKDADGNDIVFDGGIFEYGY